MKRKVTPERYIELLNEELRRHPETKPEMVFVAVPAGARGRQITGYELKNMNGRKDLFAEISQGIFLRYQIAP